MLGPLSYNNRQVMYLIKRGEVCQKNRLLFRFYNLVVGYKKKTITDLLLSVCYQVKGERISWNTKKNGFQFLLQKKKKKIG